MRYRRLWSAPAQEWEEGDGDYVAPELMDLATQASPAADMYSLGATLFECAGGERLPRSEAPAAAVARLQQRGVGRPLQNLIAALLAADPTARPTAQVRPTLLPARRTCFHFPRRPQHPQPAATGRYLGAPVSYLPCWLRA